jgi:hypothetical protein
MVGGGEDKKLPAGAMRENVGGDGSSTSSTQRVVIARDKIPARRWLRATVGFPHKPTSLHLVTLHNYSRLVSCLSSCSSLWSAELSLYN